MTAKTPFEFADDAVGASTRDAYVAHLPANLANKQALLGALYQTLQLPGYFGFNWDALSDCLRDLHWLEPRAVILVHADLPPLPAPDRRIYLEVLAEAVRSWRPGEEHQLRVVFPAAARAEVTAGLTG